LSRLQAGGEAAISGAETVEFGFDFGEKIGNCDFGDWNLRLRQRR
jgi:hypothetical protein